MPSQIVMSYRGTLPCPIDISSAATVLYYKVVGVWADVACHAAAGPVALRWAVSNAAADGLMLLVTLLLVQVALLLLLHWDVSNAAAGGLLLLVALVMVMVLLVCLLCG
jgi:hypothetical protein